MTAIKVHKEYFQGSGRIWDREIGLGPIIKGLAIDNARLAIAVAAVLDFTDNSTGADGAPVANVVLPSAVIDASGSSVGAPKAGLDTATTKLDNAFAVLAQNINIARTRLGLADADLHRHCRDARHRPGLRQDADRRHDHLDRDADLGPHRARQGPRQCQPPDLRDERSVHRDRLHAARERHHWRTSGRHRARRLRNLHGLGLGR